MKVRYLITEDTPKRYVPEGTETELDDETAKRLIAEGVVKPVAAAAERATKPKGSRAVKE